MADPAPSSGEPVAGLMFQPRPRRSLPWRAGRSVAALSALALLAVAVGTGAGKVLGTPVAAGAGLAGGLAEEFNQLSTTLPDLTLAQRTQILAGDGSPVATLYQQNRVVVGVDAMAPVMLDAVVAVEDAKFYTHKGVDYEGILRAGLRNASSEEIEQGASTITQQYVKNTLILAASSPEGAAAAKAPTVERKLAEIRYALAVEGLKSKREILEGYLNIAYFGNGAYGVEAAAQRYFGRSAKELSLGQAALLAGLVKNPNGYEPLGHLEIAQARKAVVLERMVATGKITPAQAAEAKSADIGLSPQPLPNGCEASGERAFYCQWVLETLYQNKALGDTPAEAQSRIDAGGLVIQTAMDPTKQAAAAAAARSRVDPGSRVATAVAMVEPGTGKVLALASNKVMGSDPGETYNLLPVLPNYQPGSTFKVFTLIAALQKGLDVHHRIESPESYVSTVMDNPASGSYTNASEGEGGNLDLVEATWHSVNTYYVQLLEQVGVEATAKVARDLGVSTINSSPATTPGAREGSFTLGAREVSPLDMANAYASIAARGKACAPLAILSVKAGAESLVANQPQCSQVVEPGVMDRATAILQGVPISGTGRAAAIGRPAAGKTGTTQSFGAAWYAGYTPELAAAVWLGDPRGPAHPLVNVLGQRRIFGGGIPAQVWSSAMKGALAGTPERRFAMEPLPSQSPEEAAALAAQAAAAQAAAGGGAPSSPGGTGG